MMQGTPYGLRVIQTQCQPLEALQVKAGMIDRHHVEHRDDGRDRMPRDMMLCGLWNTSTSAVCE